MDKVIHFTLYFIFTLVTIIGVKKEYIHGGFRYHPIVFSLVLVITFSCLTEILQNWVVDRNFEWMDILANMSGILAGLTGFRVLYGKRLFYL
ncbi:hypothetical protein FRX97_00075 [Luteibaculum oceani]|uniref:VanZ-like domain-containing protein n=2 Tax=Luteibaculum oceani TaxID=1294296 RepID=A0A5C6VKB5_9FLAO|nr:hypothetical protein FRX97_00075 [Luteibaculum oceani]